VYKKELHRFEIALTFAKQLLVSSFLGTYNVEKWKKFLELKFCEPGGGCLFQQTKNGLRTKFKGFNHILS
jgi:hypothetical protein